MLNRGPGFLGGYSTDQATSSAGYSTDQTLSSAGYSAAPQGSGYQSERRPLNENPFGSSSSYFSGGGQQHFFSHRAPSQTEGYERIDTTNPPCCTLL